MKKNLPEPVAWPLRSVSFYGLTIPQPSAYFDDTCSSMNSLLSQARTCEPTLTRLQDLTQSNFSERLEYQKKTGFPVPDPPAPVREPAPHEEPVTAQKKSGRSGRKKEEQRT